MGRKWPRWIRGDFVLHFAIDKKRYGIAKRNTDIISNGGIEIMWSYSVLIFRFLSFLNSVLAFIPNSLAAAVRLPLWR